MSETKKSWFPTRKWWVQFVVSLGTVATMLWTGDGINTDDEKKAVIGLGVALAGTYLMPNDNTPGGIPRRKA